MNDLEEQVMYQVWDQVRVQVSNQVWNQVNEHMPRRRELYILVVFQGLNGQVFDIVWFFRFFTSILYFTRIRQSF